MGGFDYDFVGSVNRDYVCPVCQLVLKEPHQTKCCGNHICASCVASEHSAVCPVCKEGDFRSERDKYITRKVSQLRIRCVQNARGCLWVGELITLQVHLISCQYVEMECSLKCGARVLRRNMSGHQGQHCSKRFHRCQFCLAFQGSYEQVTQEHQQRCDRAPVPCPHSCQPELVLERGSLAQHLASCPLQPVPCHFSHAGCEAQPQRSRLHAHLEQAQTTHLSLISMAMVGMVTQLQERDKEVGRLSSKLELRDRELLALRAQLAALRHDLSSRDHAPLCCPFRFTVPDLSALRQTRQAFYSRPFGAESPECCRGDRLIVALYPDGVLGGCGTHVSLCVIAVDNSSTLSATPPFTGEVTVRVLGAEKSVLHNGLPQDNASIPEDDMFSVDVPGRDLFSLQAAVATPPVTLRLLQPSFIVTSTGDSPSVEVDIMPSVYSPCPSPPPPSPLPPPSRHSISTSPLPRHDLRRLRSNSAPPKTFDKLNSEEEGLRCNVGMACGVGVLEQFILHSDLQHYLTNEGSLQLEVTEVT